MFMVYVSFRTKLSKCSKPQLGKMLLTVLGRMENFFVCSWIKMNKIFILRHEPSSFYISLLLEMKRRKRWKRYIIALESSHFVAFMIRAQYVKPFLKPVEKRWQQVYLRWWQDGTYTNAEVSGVTAFVLTVLTIKFFDSFCWDIRLQKAAGWRGRL